MFRLLPKKTRKESDMNQEISHIAQWMELWTRAKNFGLAVTYNADYFLMYKGGEKLGQYLTLAELRAGISDWVAGQRAAGVRI
jgi:hypothetical protein